MLRPGWWFFFPPLRMTLPLRINPIYTLSRWWFQICFYCHPKPSIYKGISGLVTSQGALEDWEMVMKLWEILVHLNSLSGWFQRFYMFIPICRNDPIWRIVSRWVEITNQVLKLLFFFWEHENTFGGPHRMVVKNQPTCTWKMKVGASVLFLCFNFLALILWISGFLLCQNRIYEKYIVVNLDAHPELLFVNIWSHVIVVVDLGGVLKWVQPFHKQKCQLFRNEMVTLPVKKA